MMTKSEASRLILRVVALWAMLTRGNLWVKVGGILLLAGATIVGFSPQISLLFNHKDSRTGNTEFSIEYSGGDSGPLVVGIGITLIVLGIISCCAGLFIGRTQDKPVTFFYLKGLPNQDPAAPVKDIEPEHLKNPMRPVLLNIQSSEPRGILEDLKFSIRTIESRVDAAAAESISYFAGLARVPVLYFIGYAFRQAYGAVRLIEQEHRSGAWMPLDAIGEPTGRLVVEEPPTLPDEPTDVALVLQFTTEVLESEIPKYLRGSTIRVSLSDGYRHNQITSAMDLEDVADRITQIIIRLSKRSTTLHLFLSVQATLIFAIGRRYQEGVMGAAVRIYNYDAATRTYGWAFELSRGEITLVTL